MSVPPDNPANRTAVDVISGIAVAIALGGYLAAVVGAAIVSLQQPGSVVTHPIVTAFATAVGGALATNFGALVGVSITTQGVLTTQGIGDFFRWKNLQAAAAVFYFLVLLFALAVWLLDGFFSENTAEIIRTHAATVLGVIPGILLVKLNSRQ
jgi:uncharacterized membrane protein